MSQKKVSQFLGCFLLFLEAGLSREVGEEVGIDLAALGDIEKIPEIYTYTQPNGTRMMQTFYWARANDLPIRCTEKGVEPIRIPIDDAEALLPYHEAREFYVNHIKDAICL